MTVLAPGGGAAAPPAACPRWSATRSPIRSARTPPWTTLDLRIAPGETFGLLGPNGAGKTTTIRMLVTLLACRPGSRVFGIDAAAQPCWSAG